MSANGRSLGISTFQKTARVDLELSQLPEIGVPMLRNVFATRRKGCP